MVDVAGGGGGDVVAVETDAVDVAMVVGETATVVVADDAFGDGVVVVAAAGVGFDFVLVSLYDA